MVSEEKNQEDKNPRKQSVPEIYSLISFYFFGRCFFKFCLSDFKAVNSLMSRCSLVIIIHHFLQHSLDLCNFFFLCVLIIREDLRLNDAITFPYQNFLHQTMFTDLVFQFFRRNIFTIFRNKIPPEKQKALKLKPFSTINISNI